MLKCVWSCHISLLMLMAARKYDGTLMFILKKRSKLLLSGCPDRGICANTLNFSANTKAFEYKPYHMKLRKHTRTAVLVQDPLQMSRYTICDSTRTAFRSIMLCPIKGINYRIGSHLRMCPNLKILLESHKQTVIRKCYFG